ncbi:MAG: aminopeptidase [Chloroflexi bacterium HGW-Chloroflexi-2]|jgi:endoglucanase|nr:MAG: aminopeptidase [Chloroflexi bacterium HGW-Chloroflexi-2]
MKSLIKKLVETVGPSGYESRIREVVRAEVEKYADEISVDAMGNLIVKKGEKKEGGLKVMLSAHIDEIGVMVTHVDKNGFARFTTIGGVRPHTCYGSRVRFLNGTVGVIGGEMLENANHVHAIEAMYIDVGATSVEDCPVKIGDVAAFDRPFEDLGNRLVSKAMDDRVCAAVLIETLKNVKNSPHELYFVFSTQEEVGLRGATSAAYSIDPDLGIASDVTMTGDTPRGIKMDVALGKGPAIKVKDGGMLADPKVVDAMVQCAQKHEIPYQLEVLLGGTTDAKAMQISRAGMPAGCVSVPTRYVHTPSEMVDINDLNNAVKLLTAFISETIKLE